MMSSQLFLIEGFAIDLSEITDVEFDSKGRISDTYIGIKGVGERRKVKLGQHKAKELIKAWFAFKSHIIEINSHATSHIS